MEGTAGAPPQRVCPRCARISWATGPRCPYCRAPFRRTSTGTVAWMLALAVVVTLAGVAIMFLIAGRRFNDELEDRSAQIQRDFDAQVSRIRQDVRNQIGALPTATPFPAPTPAPTLSPSPSPGATATRTPTATATPLTP